MAHKQTKKQARKPVKKATARARTPAKRKAKVRGAAHPLKKKKVSKRRNAVRPVKKARTRVTKAKARKPARKVAKALVKKTPARKALPKKTPKVMAPPAARTAAAAPVSARSAAPARRRATSPPARLQRERRRLPEADSEDFSDLSDDSRLMSSARAGHDELRSELKRHTQSSPAMTAGDVDAKWQDAYALGDEAPGGDNMTPGQDRVDDIGKALGIEYADDEELMGGEELTARDEHRWELDPASKEDEDQ